MGGLNYTGEKMFTVIDAIVLILVTYRLSLMLVSEDGSFSVTYALRLLGGNVKPLSRGANDEAVSKWQAWKDSLVSNGRSTIVTNHLGKLLACIYCTSVWIGVVVVPLYEISRGTFFIYLFYGLALSSVTIFISKLMSR